MERLKYILPTEKIKTQHIPRKLKKQYKKTWGESFYYELVHDDMYKSDWISDEWYNEEMERRKQKIRELKLKKIIL